MGGDGGPLTPSKLVAHCLLIETTEGLVLVDTGLGTGDMADPRRLGGPFRAFVRPQLDPTETAIRQIEGLGLAPGDVRHVIATHLDLDHAGGLGDFPDAEVHVFGSELAAAQSPPLRDRGRYIAAQWAHGPKWVSYEGGGDSWFGFDSVRLLPGLDTEIAMVPLAGHSAGNVGVAIRTPDGWLLHCGDAYFHHDEVAAAPSCPPALRFFQTVMQRDGEARRANQERLRELARDHPGEVRLFCSHDPEELERERSTAT